MKKGIKIFLIILAILVIVLLADMVQLKFFNNRNLDSQTNISDENTNKNEVDKIMEDVININVTINNQKYNATIENNETARSFISKLPQEFNMKELNGNEKYIYLDETLPTNSYNPKHIEKGDIMLYGNNCLVVFYKSFDTSYSYTKIGHIQELPDLGNKNIIIKFNNI